MLVSELMELLKNAPPHAQVCTREPKNSEYKPVLGVEIKRAYKCSLNHTKSGLPYLYSAVEWPSDWPKTDVVRLVL